MGITIEEVNALLDRVREDPSRVLLSFGDSQILDEVAGLVRENLGPKDYAEFLKELKTRLYHKEPEQSGRSLNVLHAKVGNCEICPNVKDPNLPLWNRQDPDVLLLSKEPLAKDDGTKFLVQAMKEVDLDSDIVGATSVARCSPRSGSLDNETYGTCATTYLYKEVALMAPTVIVTLGSIPFFTLFGKKEKVNDVVGNVRHLGGFTVVPTFDPSYALRSERRKQDFINHIQKIKPLLESQDE